MHPELRKDINGPVAFSEADERRRDPARMFGGREKHCLSKYILQAGRDSGVTLAGREPHAHALRASFATRMLEKGVPLHVVSRLFGHASLKATARYAAASDSALRDAVSLL